MRFELSLFFVLVFSSQTAMAQSGVWINPNLTNGYNFVIFDFNEKKVTTLDGREFPLTKEGKTFSVDKSNVILDFKRFEQTKDSLFFYLDLDGQEKRISMIAEKKFRNANNFQPSDLVGNVFQVSSNTVTSLEYFEFLKVLDQAISTRISNADTVSSSFSIRFYQVGGVWVLRREYPVNTFFFISKVDRNNFEMMYRHPFRLGRYGRDRMKKVKIQESFLKRLLGVWDREFIDDERNKHLTFPPDSIRQIEFASKYFSIDIDEVVSPWYVSQFRKLIIFDSGDGIGHLDLNYSQDLIDLEINRYFYRFRRRRTN
jgi:hypothetical protein